MSRQAQIVTRFLSKFSSCSLPPKSCYATKNAPRFWWFFKKITVTIKNRVTVKPNRDTIFPVPINRPSYLSTSHTLFPTVTLPKFFLKPYPRNSTLSPWISYHPNTTQHKFIQKISSLSHNSSPQTTTFTSSKTTYLHQIFTPSWYSYHPKTPHEQPKERKPPPIQPPLTKDKDPIPYPQPMLNGLYRRTQGQSLKRAEVLR